MIDDGPGPEMSLPAKVLRRIDHICLEFETALQGDQRPRIEDHLGEFEGSERTLLLRELLLLELDYRQTELKSPAAAEYESRFSDDVALIGDVFRQHLSEVGEAAARSPDVVSGEVSTGHAASDGTDVSENRPGDGLSDDMLPGRARFRVLKPHAKGGLGEVFIAYDRQLNRQVALKEIQKQHTNNPTGLVRFTLEAEVTGGLEHPGIVPVYASGAHSDGRPFYTMRLIRGESLKEAVEQFHGCAETRGPYKSTIEFRSLLGRFIDVCQTIAFAHSRGVIHRDIKPANIMLGKHGETLVVDWGLAKVTGSGPEPLEVSKSHSPGASRSGSGSAETATGMAIGTPSYMSPEQASGHTDRLGTTSDVYSLGATFYTILTGEPPFTATDNAEIIRRVRSGDFEVPRKKNGRIPRPLEAICLKAMALEPAARYDSATALANDLEAWLADEPVSCYREPMTVRAHRWSRRHRASVAAVGVAVVVAILGGLLGTTLLAAKNRALQTANLRAERRFNLAMRAVRDYYTGVSEDVVLSQPELADIRTKLLKTPLKYYDELCQEFQDDTSPASRHALADAYSAIARITQRTDSGDDAVNSYRKAIELSEALVAEFPTVPDYAESLASHYFHLGILQRARGRPREALRSTNKAISLAEGLVANYPDVPNYQGELAKYHNAVGSLHQLVGDRAEAVKHFKTAIQFGEELAAAGADAAYRSPLAGAYNNLGILHFHNHQWPAASGCYEKAVSLRKALVEQDPHFPGHRNSLAKLYHNLSSLCRARKDFPGALKNCREAIQIQQALVAEYANVTDYRNDLAKHYHMLGDLQRAVGDDQAGRSSYDQAIEVYAYLVEQHPDVPEYAGGAAQVYQNLGNLQRRQRDLAGALQCYQRAAKTHTKLASEYPHVIRYQRELARNYQSEGNLLRAMGKPDEAVDRCRQSIDVQEKVVEEYPDVVVHRDELFQYCRNLGHYYVDFSQWQNAFDAYIKALEACEWLAEEHPDNADYQTYLARTCSNLGNLKRILGEPEAAVRYGQRAVEVDEKLVAHHPDIVEHRSLLAKHSHNLGLGFQLMSEYENALRCFQKAAGAHEALSKSHPEVVSFRSDTAKCYDMIGLLLDDMNRHDEAIESCEKAVEIQEKLVADHPTVPGFTVILGGIYCNRGSLARAVDDFESALTWYGLAIEKLVLILSSGGRNPRARQYLCNSYVGRAQTLSRMARFPEAITQWDEALAVVGGKNVPLQMSRARSRALAGDHANATREADQLLEESDVSGVVLYDIACVYSLSMSAVAEDKELGSDERASLSNKYAEMAVALLVKVRDADVFERSTFRRRLVEDAELEALRPRDDFQQLLPQSKSLNEGGSARTIEK